MEQIDKLKEEFDKEFGPRTIWVVPSKENIETIKDIWSWIIQNFTPKEEVKKIDMKNGRSALALDVDFVDGADSGLPGHFFAANVLLDLWTGL